MLDLRLLLFLLVVFLILRAVCMRISRERAKRELLEFLRWEDREDVSAQEVTDCVREMFKMAEKPERAFPPPEKSRLALALRAHQLARKAGMLNPQGPYGRL
ncbi:MAG: hypothetical protein Q8Q38_00385 [bacterium]|nr:hypothetical protein [bacterium]